MKRNPRAATAVTSGASHYTNVVSPKETSHLPLWASRLSLHHMSCLNGVMDRWPYLLSKRAPKYGPRAVIKHMSRGHGQSPSDVMPLETLGPDSAISGARICL